MYLFNPLRPGSVHTDTIADGAVTLVKTDFETNPIPVSAGGTGTTDPTTSDASYLTTTGTGTEKKLAVSPAFSWPSVFGHGLSVSSTPRGINIGAGFLIDVPASPTIPAFVIQDSSGAHWLWVDKDGSTKFNEGATDETVISGKVTKYAGETTAGRGVPVILAYIEPINPTFNVNNGIVTPATGGTFRYSVYLVLTTQANVDVEVNAVFIDQFTGDLENMLLFTVPSGAAAGETFSSVVTVRVGNGNSLYYALVGAGATFACDMAICIERLN